MIAIARTLRVQVQYLDVRGPNDIEKAFRVARSGRGDAVLMLTSAVLFSHREQVVDLAATSRLPVMHFVTSPGFPAGGGLMSYGASRTDMDRRAATFVDRILKGAKPADLPIEQPTKFEFIINLKAAKADWADNPAGCARAGRRSCSIGVTTQAWGSSWKRAI
jgi:putative ABC transport system substrate-binding protein